MLKPGPNWEPRSCRALRRGAPLLRKFKEAQADRAEQDRVVGALRAMLRDSGLPDARVDTAVDKVGQILLATS